MQKLLIRMMMHSRDVVTSAYVAYMRKHNNNNEKGREYLASNGFGVADGEGPLTSDGREAFEAYGRRWALRPEIHAERLRTAMDEAKARDAASKSMEREATEAVVTEAVVAEAIAATTCPQMIDGKPCGGALNRRGVCPSCVTGRMGYKYRYTCESCGCDIVTRGELK